MFQAAFAAADLSDVTYVRLPVVRDQFEAQLEQLKMQGFRGANVTMPYKPLAARSADTRSSEVARSGSANTLVIDDAGRVAAYATDGLGMQRALDGIGVDLRDKRVLLMGAGGVAADAAFTLAGLGIASLVIWNRTLRNAQHLADALRSGVPQLPLEVCAALPIHVPAHVLVAAVPEPAVPKQALTSIVRGGIVIDFAYRQDRRDTALIGVARERGAKFVAGRDLLVYQGAASFELWFGAIPAIEEMKRAVG